MTVLSRDKTEASPSPGGGTVGLGGGGEYMKMNR